MRVGALPEAFAVLRPDAASAEGPHSRVAEGCHIIRMSHTMSEYAAERAVKIQRLMFAPKTNAYATEDPCQHCAKPWTPVQKMTQTTGVGSGFRDCSKCLLKDIHVYVHMYVYVYTYIHGRTTYAYIYICG